MIFENIRTDDFSPSGLSHTEITDDMITYPDRFLGFVDVYDKNKLEDDKKGACPCGDRQPPQARP